MRIRFPVRGVPVCIACGLERLLVVLQVRLRSRERAAVLHLENDLAGFFWEDQENFCRSAEF